VLFIPTPKHALDADTSYDVSISSSPFPPFLRRFNGIQDNIQTSLLLRESSGIIVAGSACLDFLAFDGRSDLFSGGII
jgi:hypothetical protein